MKESVTPSLLKARAIRKMEGRAERLGQLWHSRGSSHVMREQPPQGGAKIFDEKAKPGKNKERGERCITQEEWPRRDAAR